MSTHPTDRPAGRRRPFLTILLCLSASTLAGCPSPGDDAPRVAERLVIDPETIEIGDPVGLFHLAELSARPAEPSANRPRWYGEAVFTGEVQFAGRYFDFQQEIESPGTSNPCFEVDDDDARHLPRFPGDDRLGWFCFTDRDEAIASLGLPTPEGRLTSVVISKFHYRHEPTDMVNHAVLADVEHDRGRVLPETPPGIDPEAPTME